MLNYASPVSAICPVYFFLWYISANLCRSSAILIDQRWKTGGSNSNWIMLAPPQMPCRVFSVAYQYKPLPQDDILTYSNCLFINARNIPKNSFRGFRGVNISKSPEVALNHCASFPTLVYCLPQWSWIHWSCEKIFFVGTNDLVKFQIYSVTFDQ